MPGPEKAQQQIEGTSPSQNANQNLATGAAVRTPIRPSVLPQARPALAVLKVVP